MVEATLLSLGEKKILILEIIVLLCLCFLPIFWYKGGSFYANGDDFPLFLNRHLTLESGTSLWSTNYLGYATPTPAYLIYQYIGASLSTLGLSVGAIQTVFLVSLFILAALSMFYLTRKIYPNSTLAAFFASFFYILNFFFLINLRNIGFRWTYAFLPLILALFFQIMTAANQNNKTLANKRIIYFALVSIVAFSFASINPANIALFLIALSVMALYFLAKFKAKIKLYLFSIAKVFGATFVVSLWWLIPVLNSFIFSGQALSSQVSIDSWGWTQARSSFLNLFWLNGSWNWSEEYYPFVLQYSTNALLIILAFVPFLIAASALLIKSNKMRLNAFLMGTVLLFLFLAKGVHNFGSDPLAIVNYFLYQAIPFMSMFRESVSKFTIVMLPFLALLVGYGAARITSIRIRKLKFSYTKASLSMFLVIILLVPVYPILADRMETRTKDLPFSSQVSIPDYWYQATGWVNNQPGDWKVLLTPLDDYYQIPYEWGYYGTDQLLERLFEKPIVSTAVLNGYVGSLNAAETIKQIKESVKFNNTAEFKALLDILSIRYIFQRNDINDSRIEQFKLYNDVNATVHNRDLEKPLEMREFLANQRYLQLIGSYGQNGEIDIYEYTESKPLIYALLPSNLDEANVHIEKSTYSFSWNFSLKNDINNWRNSTPNNQSQATCEITGQNGNLKADITNSTSGWVVVDSPFIQSDNESSYKININIEALNIRNISYAIGDYSENKTLLATTSFVEFQYGNWTDSTGNWAFQKTWNISYSFTVEPKNQNTKYLQLQIWNYFEPSRNESFLKISSLNISGTMSTLNVDGINDIFSQSISDSAVLNSQDVNPTRIVVNVNASQPFILAVSQELDKFWVASINGQRLEPISLYLGLKGFLVNKTGQYSVVLEYQPQIWFNYSLVILVVAVSFACLGLLYLSKDRVMAVFNYDIRKHKKE